MKRHVPGMILLLWVVTGIAQAEDWPTWRHDRLRTGVTSERLDPPLEQVWAFRSRQSRLAPKPEHSPHQAKYPWLTWYTLPISAAGDALFLGSAADGRTVCLEAATGKVRWEFFAGAAVNRTPMIWEGKVYVGSDDGHAYCLDASTGSLIWKYKAAPTDRWMVAYGKPVSLWPVRTDVLVDDGVAYFGAGVFPHDGTYLYAVNARTGKLLWRNGTQCETGWRSSMSPAGHLFVTNKSIWVPKDCWGYFLNWYTLVSFDRATGGPMRSGPGKDEWPEWPNLAGPFWPVFGVRKDGVRYFGAHAAKIDEKDKNKQIQLWRQDLPGRWTDVDSVLSVRAKRPVFFRYDPDLSTVVYAGGVLYHTAFEMDLKKGTGSGIYARDPNDGKLLWSAEVPERANQLIAANGRLFAATRQGTIYAFAPKGAKKHGVIEEPVDGKPLGDTKAFAPAAAAIIKQSGVKAGYALVLDCENGELACELAKHTSLYVVAVFRDADNAAAARKAYARANLHVSRVVAYHQQDGAALPFPSFFADLIVSEAAAGGGALPQYTENLNRMLKPIRGVALIGGKQSEDTLKKWIDATKQTGWATVKGGNVWAKRVRPRLEDAGGWFHTYADAGHTNCSRDGALKPPLGVLWYGAPHLDQGGGGPGSWIVDGVLLLPEGTTLFAYDQYTGRELWRRGHSRTDTVAAPGSVFLRYLEVVARLDPATGKTLQEYRPPFADGKWQAMAADRDGKTLYLAAGGDPWRCVLAVDVASGKPRWTLGGPGKKKQWGGWSAIGDGYIYFGGGAAQGALREEVVAEMRAYLKADDPKRLEKFEKELDQHEFRTFTTVDAKTGKVLYTHGVDVTNCGGKWLPGVGYGGGRYARHYNPFVFGCTIAQKDVIIFCTASGADKGWRVWPAGGYKQRSITVHDGATGKLLWKKPADYRTRPVVVDDTIYAEPWGYDLKTGKRTTRVHPITGDEADWAWCRADKQCGIFCASKHFLFGRSLGVGYQDLLTDQGLYTFFHSRMNCSFDAVSGGGMMIKPPQAIYCRCSWSLPFTIAMGQVTTPPTVGQVFAQPGLVLPVKHLYLDFGATGDRRDSNGNLWLRDQHPRGHKLLIGLDVTAVLYEGGSEVRRSSIYTPIENTDVPFVFATALRGLKRCVVPVTTPRDGKGVYTVRLGFSALPGDKPGQRVFDVKLGGKTVLKDFDIIKEAGKPDKAVWKEFEVPLEGDLVLDLVAKSDKPTVDKMPLVNGLQVLRKEMTTLGLDLPGRVVLNRSKPEETVTVALANLRSAPFVGKLVFEAPQNVEISAAGGGAVAVQPAARTRLSVRFAATDKAKVGVQTAKVKLLGTDGKVALEHKMAVQWLGALEREVLQGGSRSFLAGRNQWGRQVRPDPAWQRLDVSSGARTAGDDGTAYSYVWFSVPEELRGRIRSARLRLHVAPRLWKVRDALFSPLGGSRPPPDNCWGALKQLKGPPWPDFNKFTYPDRPETLTETSTLRPTQWDQNVVEGPIPGSLDHVEKSHHVYLAVESTSLNGVVYWSHQHHDRTKAPALVIDYEPEK